MKKNILYIFCGSLLMMASCASQDAPGIEVAGEEEGAICFRTNIADAGVTRGSVLTEGDGNGAGIFSEFQVTCFFGAHNKPSAENAEKYFENVKFSKAAAENGKTRFKSETTYIWPVTTLDFFAYYPELPMSGFANSADGYVYSGFEVSKDIDKHVDFVTAHKAQTYKSHVDSEVEIEFEHRLSQIELQALCSNPRYVVEVAGVRLGNVTLKGDYNFCAADHAAEGATPASFTNTTKGNTEYLFGDGKIVTLTKDNANLMANCGNALVIPADLSANAWDSSKDPANENQGMYFSVLIRITTPDGIQLYPAKGLDDADQVKIVEVKNAAGSTEQFGWAAIPYGADWKEGMKYVYTLDYSNGAGVRDPQDVHAGDPVLGGDLKVTVKLKDWIENQETIYVPGKDKEENSETNK